MPNVNLLAAQKPNAVSFRDENIRQNTFKSAHEFHYRKKNVTMHNETADYASCGTYFTSGSSIFRKKRMDAAVPRNGEARTQGATRLVYFHCAFSSYLGIRALSVAVCSPPLLCVRSPGHNARGCDPSGMALHEQHIINRTCNTKTIDHLSNTDRETKDRATKQSAQFAWASTLANTNRPSDPPPPATSNLN